MVDGDPGGESRRRSSPLGLHEPPESGERWGFPAALKEVHAAALVSAGVGAYPGRFPGPAPPSAISYVTAQREGRQGGWQRPATLKGSSKRRAASEETTDEPEGLPSPRGGDGQRWVDLAASSANRGVARCQDRDREDSPKALSRESLGGALIAARRVSAGVRSPRASLAMAVLSPPASLAGGPARHAPALNACEDDEIGRYLDYFAERDISSQVGPRGSQYVASATGHGEPEAGSFQADRLRIRAPALSPANL